MVTLTNCGRSHSRGLGVCGKSSMGFCKKVIGAKQKWSMTHLTCRQFAQVLDVYISILEHG